MTSDRRTRRPVAISAFDLVGAHNLLVHGCEDCACAVTDERALRTPESIRSALERDDGRWVTGREVIEWTLDAEHRLLFNPVGHGGVVVVNDAAHRIFESFRQAATFGDAQGSTADRECTAVMRRLGELEMIYPEGQPQRPEFTAGQILTAWLHVTNACISTPPHA